MDQKAFAAMKPDACLINVARGRVVDKAALIAALRNRSIAAAALDTYVDEPLPPESPLWQLPDLVMTSHVAGKRSSMNVMSWISCSITSGRWKRAPHCATRSYDLADVYGWPVDGRIIRHSGCRPCENRQQPLI